MELLSYILDPQKLIAAVGLIGIFMVVFAESGLLIGFFLPGDSLLFTAGFLASQNYLPLWPLVIGSIVAAIIGDSVGYAFGKKVGPKIFVKEESVFFHKEHLQKAATFFHQHGGKSLILARFMPVIRTFVPILAGVGKMEYRRFLAYNCIGGFLWGGGVTLLGYFLGQTIPDIDKYLLPIILAIIFISILPSILFSFSSRK